MTTLIVNSNRIDLVDPVSGLNKSIEVDSVNHTLVVDDGTGGGTTYPLANKAQLDSAVETIDETTGSLNNLITSAKTNLVAAVNEVANDASAANSAAIQASVAVDNAIISTNDVIDALNKAASYNGTATLAVANWKANTDSDTNSQYPYKYDYFDTGIKMPTDASTSDYQLIANFRPRDLITEKSAKLAGFVTLSLTLVTTVDNPFKYPNITFYAEAIPSGPVVSAWSLIYSKRLVLPKIPTGGN